MLGCDFIKKFLFTLSPATQFLYSLVLFAFLREYSVEGTSATFFWYFCMCFMVYSLMNALYEIVSEKKRYETYRRFILNIFYLVSTCILLYSLAHTHLIPIFSNFSLFITRIKEWVVCDRTFLGKIGAVLRILFTVGSTGTMVYKYISKYMETPEYSEINIYKSINSSQLHRQNNEYHKVNVLTSIILPLISMIVNFFTSNSITAYIFSAASILQSFEVTHLNKRCTHILPMLLSVTSAIIVGLQFFEVVCKPVQVTV